MNRPVDLRSDTVTKPTPEMRRAMAEAEVGDDMFGEDPTVNRLEEVCCRRLGKEAALFVSSGTMANLLAFLVQTRPGDEVIFDAQSHPIHAETGGISGVCGAQARPVAGARGQLTPELIEAAVRADAVHLPRTALVSLENTHNNAGGTVYPPEQLWACCDKAHALRLSVHLDGARLHNASVACGVSVKELAREADTVSTCFSKGLGAPVGSILAGSRDLIREARRARKRVGGAMRQAGILAAAALYALQHHVERLIEDHAHAQRLAEGLAELPGVSLRPHDVETNIVMIDLTDKAPPTNEVVERLAGEGVLLFAFGPRRLRAVTHLDVSRDDIDRALVVFRRVLGGTR
ncbi:aminotransferase class I/II-fold pyridoxal phosphate-dependent enzyme [bacterium]|nr:aminotransferase class I/II-fold pyridoxal phosphate-dependent enzyme [bacterium]